MAVACDSGLTSIKKPTKIGIPSNFAECIALLLSIDLLPVPIQGIDFLDSNVMSDQRISLGSQAKFYPGEHSGQANSIQTGYLLHITVADSHPHDGRIAPVAQVVNPMAVRRPAHQSRSLRQSAPGMGSEIEQHDPLTIQRHCRSVAAVRRPLGREKSLRSGNRFHLTGGEVQDVNGDLLWLTPGNVAVHQFGAVGRPTRPQFAAAAPRGQRWIASGGGNQIEPGSYAD